MSTNETATLSDSIGNILKEARLAQGLTIESIAERLRIGKRKIASLEEEDEELKYDVYNIGFLRLYARHLGLDEEDLCNKFKETRKPFEPASLNLPAPTPGRGMPSLTILGFSFISFIVMLLGWRWYEQKHSAQTVAPQIDIEPAIPPVEPPSVSNEPPLPPLENNHNFLSPTPFLSETGISIPLSSTLEESLSASAPQPVSAPEKIVTPTPVSAPEPIAAPEKIVEPTTISSPEPITAAERMVDPAPISGPMDPSSIRINAIEDAWVEVKDHEGNILASRTLSPGESLEFQNPTSLYLKTGNARGVQLISAHKTISSLGNAGEVKSGISLDPKNWVEVSPQTDYQE